MIVLQGLRYRYAQGPEIAFADLSLPPGQGLLLRGASGSGKSTLLALMAGLLSASAGRLEMAGAELGRLSPRQRDAWRGACLGFVPQRLHLSAALTVRDNLALPYLSAGLPVDHARIDELLQCLELQALAPRRPHQLSLGQAQRVALARALLRRPKLLLADEPTANLDDESAGAALNLLSQAAREQGATLVLATHDSRVAQALGGELQDMRLPKLMAMNEAAR
ncbi:ABC transporter ATP-binding protein [Paucibacter sp. M5-1]|uniref:ABC transporter ATP-binding protein n=1 Tax=Paucibacter sp. M5-1 TaxID=3015998 RepID=UPI0022B8C0AE|nr:ATP-binding cassette domain-containing protein [Paucibacter sp. M5-1]MCZ7884579.1 ATP-binding cassette domain-containing protein [Paucibacter sp. M5-1]